MTKRSGRGMSLGGTLLAVALLSLLAFTLATLSLTHVRLFSRQEAALAASNAARSAISTAISELVRHRDFGEQRLAGEDIRVETEAANAVLTFDRALAREGRFDYSTNNLFQTENVNGARGVVVPASTAHLVAVGRCGEVQRTVEAVLRLPPFPWAVASHGDIAVSNSIIAALPAGCLPPEENWPPPLEQLKPADLVANSEASDAVVLGPGVEIYGDVETGGGVTGPGQSGVRGAILQGSNPVELPVVRPASLDPELTGVTHSALLGDNTQETLVGSVRQEGSIRFDHTLTLSNAQLFVNGDLQLLNGVKGSGTLVATGDITIGGGSYLVGLTELGVLSGGRIVMTGAGPDRGCVMRGLFYAEDGIEASGLTLIGSLLTAEDAGAASGGEGVTLENVNVYYEPPAVAPTVSSGISSGGLMCSFTAMVAYMGSTIVPANDDAAYQSSPEDIGFYVDLEPQDGDYPVEITVRQGYLAINVGPRVINSEAELGPFLDELQVAMENCAGLRVSQGPMGMFGVSNIAPAIEAVRTSIGSAMGGGATGPGQHPALVPFEDISRFLPLEDRLRVVSWVER